MRRPMWWRPISAIQEVNDDGDAVTVADPSWTPLLTTPPYPEWPSGLCSVIGALTATLERTTGVDITLASTNYGSRQFTSKAQLDQDAVDARVFGGIHFRTSDEASIEIGTVVTEYVMDRYFAPTP